MRESEFGYAMGLSVTGALATQPRAHACWPTRPAALSLMPDRLPQAALAAVHPAFAPSTRRRCGVELQYPSIGGWLSRATNEFSVGARGTHGMLVGHQQGQEAVNDGESTGFDSVRVKGA
jgi:hypothetical protein